MTSDRPLDYEESLRNGVNTATSLFSGVAGLIQGIRPTKLEEKRTLEPLPAQRNYLPWIIGGVAAVVLVIFGIKLLK